MGAGTVLCRVLGAVVGSVLVITLIPATAHAEVLDELLLETSERVLVEDEGDEYALVYDNPDGTSTAEFHAQPQRVRGDSGWVPVDTTLVEAPGGVWRPRATVTDVAFGSGDAAMVTIAAGGAQLGVSWPAVELPRPEVEGNRATYVDVLPGVDLVLTALAHGYRQVVVVKTPEAADLPQVRRLTFEYEVSGGELVENEDRSLSVLAGGAEVLAGPAPLMWDAGTPSGEVVSQVPPAGVSLLAQADLVEGAQEGSTERPLSLEVADGVISMVPNPELLAGAATDYPVVIDPALGATRNRWVMVDRRYATTSYHQWADASQGVGYVNESGDWHNKRLFWLFSGMGGLVGSQVLSATFRAYQVHSWSCTPSEVQAWSTRGMPASVTWNTQPDLVDHIGSAMTAVGRTGCVPGGQWIEFDARAAVQGNLDAGWSSQTFALKANNSDEAGNSNSWKRFRSDAQLSITYNRKPAVSASSIQLPHGGGTCTTNAPDEPWSATRSPQVSYVVTDPDGDNVRGVVTFKGVGASAGIGTVGTVTAPLVGQNTRQVVTLPRAPADGRYGVIVQPRDAHNLNGTSVGCHINIDTVAPNPPGVSSTNYPSDSWAGSATTAGRFRFDHSGQPAGEVLEGFYWALDNSSPNTWAALGSGSYTEVSAPPGSPGRHTVYVQAVDRAGNRSSVASYSFYVSSSTDALVYRFDESAGAVALDGGGRGFHGSLQNGASVGTAGSGRSGSLEDRAVVLDGIDDAVSVPRSGAVDTSRSFSVSAVVERSRGAGAETIASIDGTASSAFTLGWRTSTGTLAFRYNTTDSATAPVWREASVVLPPPGPGEGAWMAVTGVYEVGTGGLAGQARALLYVDGELLASTDWSGARAFTAGGYLRIGRSHAGEHWQGRIDEVRMSQSALSAAEARSFAATSATATRFAPSTGSGDLMLLASREDALVSPDGNYTLVMQGDGNLVLHDLRNGSRVTRWASNTRNSGSDRAVMQQDGNLVVYAGSQPTWASNTWVNNAGAHLQVQNDGQAVITSLSGAVRWTSAVPANPVTTGPSGAPDHEQLDGQAAGPTTPIPPQTLPGHVSEGDPQAPAADTETVDVVTEPQLDLGGVDVGLAPTVPPDPGSEQPVRVTGFPQAAADAAGAEALVKIEPTAGTSPEEVLLDVALDDFAGTADWDSRATVYEMPGCAATTPTVPSCRTMTPVATEFVGTGDGGGGSVISSSVSVSSQSVLAIASRVSGPAGSWAATPLSPAASWRLAENTGDFTWAYPFEVPGLDEVPGVSLGLSYSSGSVDGRTSGTNSQASWVGDGFEMSPGYVERTFVTCRDDRSGGNNATRATGDLCWQSTGGRVVEDVHIVLEGRATRVIKDATTGTWRLQEDDGSRFERLTGAPNGAQNGEYFKLTATDGTQYFFGLTRRPGGPGGEDTKSTWTVPVYGNHSGEPCFQSGNFAGSSCAQGWRWNLDYVVDVDGDTSTLFYEREDNRYGANNTPTSAVSYTRGGWLTRLEYGGRAGSETATAPVRMTITVAERCESWGAGTCQPAQLTRATKDRWPDVPFDLICDPGVAACPASSPTFFTRKKLVEVQSEVYTSGAYRPVDRWTLTHQFPNSGEGSAVAPALWLAQIERTAMDPDPGKRITLPPVQLHGTQLPNRIDGLGDGAYAMFRYRINKIVTETGGVVSVNYSGTTGAPSSDPLCQAPTGAVPNPPRPTPSSNGSRCFPALYTIDGASQPTVHWFHKYLVDSVIVSDMHGTSAATQTSYTYEGAGAWAYSASDTTAPKDRTWNQWRGYSSVLTTVGAAGEAPLLTRTFYLRGMHGDYLAPGQTRSVTVTIDDPERAPAADPTYVDDPRFAGYVAASITYDGSQVVTVTINEQPWKSSAKATSVNPAVGSAYLIGEAVTRTLTRTAAGGWQRVEAFTTFDDATGRVTQVHDAGDVATPADDTCTRYTYVDNTAVWLRNLVSRAETFAGTCGSPGARLRGEQVYYDGATSLTATPTRGLATKVEQLDGATPASATYRVVATAGYDAHGRQTSATRDPAGVNATTTVAFTPAQGWPVTRVQTTNPVGHVSTVDLDPARQVVTGSTDVRGARTTLRYDAMGRVTGVWAPDRSTSGRASTEYAYAVSATAPPSVETRALVMAGTRTERYVSSFAVFDGLLRPRQTQGPDARGVTGRVVTDTRYDSRGLVVEVAGPVARQA
jgi:YD repeat-containing protein